MSYYQQIIDNRQNGYAIGQNSPKMFTAQIIQTGGNSAINGDATENISVVLSLATRGEDGAASLTSAIIGQSVQALLTDGLWNGRFLPRPSRQHDLLMTKVVICFCCVDNKLTELIFKIFFCLYNDNFPSDWNPKAILKLLDYTIILTIILTDLEFWFILLPVLLGESMHWFHTPPVLRSKPRSLAQLANSNHWTLFVYWFSIWRQP